TRLGRRGRQRGAGERRERRERRECRVRQDLRGAVGRALDAVVCDLRRGDRQGHPVVVAGRLPEPVLALEDERRRATTGAAGLLRPAERGELDAVTAELLLDEWLPLLVRPVAPKGQV